LCESRNLIKKNYYKKSVFTCTQILTTRESCFIPYCNKLRSGCTSLSPKCF